MIASPNTTASAKLEPGRAVSTCAVAAGTTSSANTSSAPVIWLGLGHRDAEHDEEDDDSSRDAARRAAAATSGSTEANSSGRRDDREHGDARRRAIERQRHDLRVGDAEEAAEQQRVMPLRKPP